MFFRVVHVLILPCEWKIQIDDQFIDPKFVHRRTIVEHSDLLAYTQQAILINILIFWIYSTVYYVLSTVYEIQNGINSREVYR